MGKLYSSYSWAKNNSHIIFNFKAIKGDGSLAFEGVEIIYWSDLKNGIYSWCLNTPSGESPEEHWTPEDDDGIMWKLASDANHPFVIYTRKNADLFEWEQKKQIEGGEISTVFGPLDNSRL